MPCNAHESAKIIKIYYLSLEYNFPSRNSENLVFPESVKEFKGQGGRVLGSSYQTWSKSNQILPMACKYCFKFIYKVWAFLDLLPIF
jgi:hypothetical protein